VEPGRCPLEDLVSARPENPHEERAVTGSDLYRLCERLYPLCRSITGNGVRETLAALGEHIDLETFEVPTGTQVFDWVVPKEWNLERATLTTEDGRCLVDTNHSNLHVVNYSVPTDAWVSREELEPHLHSLPERPELIPYRTAYYAPAWGFCLSEQQRATLGDGPFHVQIDSSLEDGALTYGECFVPGETEAELLISTHVCHPSLANDNLSGITVATHLAKYFAGSDRLRFGLRFIFVPSTIGAITWLARNEQRLGKLIGGLIISGVGDSGSFTYKLSRRGDGIVDRICSGLVGDSGLGTVRPFSPYGYDERQFCSPGIDIAAGCLMRTPFGEYPEYHTSGDNLRLIGPAALEESYRLCRDILADVQRVTSYRNLSPKGEPQLGRRGLYQQIGGDNEAKDRQLAMLWLLSYSDGRHSTLDISELSGIPLSRLEEIARLLVDADLLEELPTGN